MFLHFCFKLKMANDRRQTIIEFDCLNLSEIGRRFKNMITSASGGAGSLVYLLSISSVPDVTSSATNKIGIMERFGDACIKNAKRK